MSKLTRCRGFGGCLLRESCKRYEPGFAPAKNETFIIEQYTAMNGCPNYQARQLQPVIIDHPNR